MQKALISILIILGSLSFGIAKSSEKPWVKGEYASKTVDLNNIRFTNRARCALDSKKPTQSAYIMVNNVTVARSLYRLAKATGKNPNDVVKLGIEKYRYSVVKLFELIHQRLMNRELPLLTHNSTKNHVPSKYKRLMESCKSDEYCDELDHYIRKVWKISSNTEINNIEKVLKYYDVDNFHSKESYLDPKDFEDKKVNTKLRCHYLKKFSPLQAQLYGTKPTKELFTQMAEAAHKSDENLGSCEDFAGQTNLKVAAYQVEFDGLRSRKWDKQGFDYWNSMKLYFSWAFRNAPELEQIAFPFGEVFPAVAVEESVMFIPNGCKSITVPECDGDYLALNAIREFAKKDLRKGKLTLDVLSELPEGPEQGMLEDTFTDVNNDILDIIEHPDASAWLQNFQTNLGGTRSLMKNKLIKAVNFLNVASTHLDSKKLLVKIENQFESLSTTEGLQNASAETKNELFYLCAEYNFSHHKDFSFLRGNLDILKKTSLIDGVAGQLTKKTTEEYFKYYENIANLVIKHCASLKQREIWNEEFELDKTGYSTWYVEKVYADKYKSTMEMKAQDYIKTNKPELAYSQYKETKSWSDVLCASPSHCARKTLDSIVALFSTAQYANTFYSLDQAVKAPSLFNPYAERTSCKVYDPWYKTRAVIFNLFTDLGQAALSLVTPGLIYTNFNLQPGRVVSFRQLVDEGKIKFDSRRDRQSVQMSLIADFGPMLGVPCAVSYTRTNNPYNVFRFSGISVSACTQNEDNDMVVRTASDYDDNETNNRAGCVNCAINFETAATAASTLSPNVGTTFFLVKAMVRLYKGLKDPFNIPKTWEANPNYVLDSYKRFGEIKKSCVRKLRKGKQCLDTSCEESIAERIYNNVNASIKGIDTTTERGKALVSVHGCNEPIVIKINKSFDADTCSAGKDVQIPASCEALRIK